MSIQDAARNLRVIDDAFFRLLAEKPEVCQEILRTILDDPKLEVINVDAQSLVQSMHREVYLDAECKLGNGNICNIEMQKGRKEDDIRRTRFHASALTANRTEKGTNFKDIPDVTVVYITEYDALGNGQAVTHVSRCMETIEGFLPLDDGEDIIFANTVVKDGSKVSELLSLMVKTEAFNDARFPGLSDAVGYYKLTRGGFMEVCKIIRDLNQQMYGDQYVVAREEGRQEGRISTIMQFINKGHSEEEANAVFECTKEELEAVREMLAAAGK